MTCTKLNDYQTRIRNRSSSDSYLTLTGEWCFAKYYNVLHSSYFRIMSFATVFTLLLLIGVAVCSLYDPQGDRQLERYRARNKILHDKLITENCTDPQLVRFKRSEVLTNQHGLRLEIEKELFEMMIKMLTQCRNSKMAATQSTTTEAKTTALPYPEECQNAINLTEEWRADNKGNRLNGMNNCDTQTMLDFGRPWF